MQGWRLDPLLLFCQLLTAGTALAWALEAINLRKVVDNDQVRKLPMLLCGRVECRFHGVILPTLT